MHRAQLLIEPWQYDALRARAERAGVSISELVRRMLSEYLTPPDEAAQATPLFAMEGIASGAVLTAGRDHDDVLYAPAEPKKRR